MLKSILSEKAHGSKRFVDQWPTGFEHTLRGFFRVSKRPRWQAGLYNQNLFLHTCVQLLGVSEIFFKSDFLRQEADNVAAPASRFNNSVQFSHSPQ